MYLKDAGKRASEVCDSNTASGVRLLYFYNATVKLIFLNTGRASPRSALAVGDYRR